MKHALLGSSSNSNVQYINITYSNEMKCMKRVSKYSTNRWSRSIRLEENRKSVWFITMFEWKEIETWLFFFANPRLRLIFVLYTGPLWLCFCISNTFLKILSLTWFLVVFKKTLNRHSSAIIFDPMVGISRFIITVIS